MPAFVRGGMLTILFTSFLVPHPAVLKAQTLESEPSTESATTAPDTPATQSPPTSQDTSLETEVGDSTESVSTTDLEESGEESTPMSSFSEEEVPDPFYGDDREPRVKEPVLETDPLDGSLRYVYPLRIPPGRNGIQPDLALIYSSRPDEQISPFGYGWSLNIPYIERINRRGTNNLYTDHTFYSSLDGEIASTTAGQGGIGDLALDEAVLLTADQTLLADVLVSPAVPLESTTTTVAATSTSREPEKKPSTGIEPLLEGKSADEKATIKGREIAKIAAVPRTERSGYELEFIAFNAIPGGVEVFARAWQSGAQIGFGRDGSVDIERFRVFNPPILVLDPEGSIERAFENPDTGEITIKRFREDPEEAMLEAIAHAIKVKKEKFSSHHIIPEKVGNTTSLFYPAAGANSPVDGWIEKEDEATWSAARDASTGDGASATTAYLQAVARKLSCGSCEYTVRRSFTFFDTSAIATSTIASATLSLKRDDAALGFANADSVSWSVGKVTSNSSDSSLATSDFNKIGSTEAGSRVQLSGTTVDTYSDFTLNSIGLGFISTSSVTRLGVRLSNDFDNTTPTGNNAIGFYAADVTGTASDPVLTVEHGSGPTSPTSLLLESLVNPMEVTDPTPEFSAVYTDQEPGSTATHYQIRVSTSSSFVSDSVWDSGKTALASSTPSGNRIPDVSYGGTTLASSTPYYWRIKFWNNDDVEGAWSTELATFRLASDGSSTYGPKIESGAFRTYERKSSGAYWEVTDKNGTIYKFGTSSSARLDDPDTTSHIYRWMLEEVRDTNGNYISYSYDKHLGQLYPASITYTGNATTPGIFTIDFTREARSDYATSSKAGFDIGSHYRINQIKASVNGNWVQKYDLGYTTGDNTGRSILSTITETGQDESSSTLSLPAVSLTSQVASDSLTLSSWHLPVAIVTDENQTYKYDNGTRIADFNGDGLPDVARYRNGASDTSYNNKIWFNNGDSTWSTTTPTGLPELVGTNGYDCGVRIADFNGDGLADVFTNSNVYINTNQGTSFVVSTTIPLSFVSSACSSTGYDLGTRLMDVNGDGLIDLVRAHKDLSGTMTRSVYLNTPSGWKNVDWYVPVAFSIALSTYGSGVDNGARIADFNGDGLPDIARYRNGADDSELNNKIFFNNGDGSWATTSPASMPAFISEVGNDRGVRVEDMNSDGLPDIAQQSFYNVLINAGPGRSFESLGVASFPLDFTDGSGNDRGVRLVDIDGDGLVDFLVANTSGDSAVYLNPGRVPDLLVQARGAQGASTHVVYKATPEYRSGSTPLNPKLPLTLQTVQEIGISDGFGTTASTTYTYGGGEYYFNTSLDRRFAGFATTTATNGLGFVTKTFAHQGNESQTSIGEYTDDQSKIGKPYRTEVYDGSNNLYAKAITRWENVDLGNGRDFVKQTRVTDFAYDGDADHKEKAGTFSYDNNTGNVTSQVEWGEVSGSDDGNFTDTGTDKFTTTITYAASTSPLISGFPSQETVVNSASTTVKDTKFYYDSLTHGNVAKGNETKRELWKIGTSWIDVEKTFNTYGLVTEEKDPRDKTITYTYDAFNVHVATSTNAKNQSTGFVYDYSLGKPKRTNDPNGLIFEVTYDALDRVTAEKQPDLTTPATLVTKTAYTYTDTIGSRKVQETRHLNAATSTDRYIYLDGLNRVIQERIEAEDTDTFAVKDFTYNEIGKVKRESLPYFGTGSARTTATSTSALFATTSYDPLNRVATIATVVGTTTHAYDDWKQTVTDPLGNVKHLYRDAYGNLTQVDEVNDTSTYTTTYQYNYLKNLTKITDAVSNIRNFTYDGLGQRLTAEDLHSSGDLTFGTWSFTYDAAGNLATTTDPKSQTIEYTYDDLSRVLTENYTGQGGTEVTYSYDTCTYGIGRLCGATTTSAGTNYTYDALGNVKTELRTIGGNAFTTTFAFDRQGNQTQITYPDNANVFYTYNAAGLLESVSKLENGTTTPVTLVDETDYGPTGAVTNRNFGNNTETTYTYDANQLYRLTNIRTTATSTGETFGQGGIGDLALDEAALLAADQTLLADPLASPAMLLEAAITTDAAISTPSEPEKTSSGTIEPLLQDKSADEKATIKGQEIAKIGSIARTTQDDYELEIVSLNPVPGGVEVFARAWQAGQQIGFGRDGSVDIERFRIFNPPILVADPEGPIAREFENPDTGEITIKHYREDMQEAVLQVLAHALEVKHETFPDTRIVPGKIGNTTSLFYPSAGANAPADGWAEKEDEASWPAARDATTGDGASATTAYLQGVARKLTCGGCEYTVRRSYVYLNTGLIGSDTIWSATLSLKRDDSALGFANGDSVSWGVAQVTSNSSDASVATSDFNKIGSTEAGSRIALSGTTVDTYSNFTLDGSGIGFINTGGTSRFGIRLSNDFDNTAPTGNNAIGFYAADTAGSTNDPVLTVEHGDAGISTAVATLQNISYTYDAAGNITQIVNSADTLAAATTTYAYDDLYRLTTASTTQATSTPYLRTYTYNAVGNIATTSDQGDYLYAGTSYANPHAATSINGTTLTYDNNGNLTAFGASAYTWNYRNELTEAGTGSATSTYGYDHQGSRVTMTTDGVTTKYANRLYSTTGATTTKHIFAGDTLIAMVEKIGSATTTHIIHPDHLGGTNVVTDAQGNLTQTLDYYPFGELRINNQATGLDETRKFTGHEYDESVGLTFMQARYQDPTRGQFLSQDLVFLAAGAPRMRAETGVDLFSYLTDPQNMNSYAYARNNPLVYRDPNGKFGVLAIIGIGALVGVTSQAIQDYSSGQSFSWQNYAGAAAGGAVGSLALIGSVAAGAPTIAPYIAGGVGGATKETISQSLSILTNERDQHDWMQVGLEGGFGAGSALLPVPKISGVTVGRNSFSAVNNQIVTRLASNNINNIVINTGSKILASQFIVSSAQSVQLGIATNSSIYQSISSQITKIQAQINSIAQQIKVIQQK